MEDMIKAESTGPAKCSCISLNSQKFSDNNEASLLYSFLQDTDSITKQIRYVSAFVICCFVVGESDQSFFSESTNFCVSLGYTEIKCDRKLAALGDSMPEVNNTMLRDGSTAIWQSIQLLLMTATGTLANCGTALCSPLWHV